MDQETFCDKYCPIPMRWIEFPKVDNELSVDCDLEENDCPFKDVDFSKVYEHSEGAKVVSMGGNIVIVCAGGCGKTTEQVGPAEFWKGKIEPSDDPDCLVPVWTCKDCVEKRQI